MSLWPIALAAFGSTASMRICDPMLIALGEEFRVSTGDASAVVSAFAVAYGVSQFFYGPMGDRIGKLRVVVGATFACALFSLLTAFAGSLQGLILCRALMGASAAGIVPLAIAWIGDQVAYERRQETLARFSGATLTGMMAGQLFGGYAVDHFGWRPAFLVLAGIFLIAATVLLRHVRRSAAPPPPEGSLADYLRNSRRLLRLPRVRWVLTVTALEGALAYGAMAFMPSRLVDAFGYTPSGAGLAMVLWGLGGLLYGQLARRWLALLGERGLALAGAGTLAVAFWILAWGSGTVAGALACFLAGVGLYMFHNTLQTQATQMAPQARGAAVTLFACVLFLTQSVGVWVIGLTLDLGALATSFTLCAAGLVMLGVWVSRHVRPRA
jgi:predicted MFS family arabinose efflux permease